MLTLFSFCSLMHSLVSSTNADGSYGMAHKNAGFLKSVQFGMHISRDLYNAYVCVNLFQILSFLTVTSKYPGVLKCSLVRLKIASSSNNWKLATNSRATRECY